MVPIRSKSEREAVADRWAGFIPLPENESALRAVRRLARGLAMSNRRGLPSPLVLHGLTGTGKTTLVEALVRTVTNDSARTARILPAADLTDDIAELDGCDLLVIEDFHRIPGKSASLIIPLLDTRLAHRLPTVVTSSVGPAGLTRLPRKLTSRLAAGLVVGLEPISPPSRRTLLRGLAESRRLPLADDAVDWLVTRTPGGGLRPLLGRVEQLVRLAAGTTAELDARSVARLLAGHSPEEPAAFDRIVNRVSVLFAVSPKDVIGPSRLRNLTAARRLAMYLARDLTDASLPQIGRYFGGRDHTTVLHACRTVEAALPEDSRLSRTIRELKAELG